MILPPHLPFLSFSMANNYFLCIVGAMDRLWFHQIILFSEPITTLVPKTTESDSEPPSNLSSTLSLSPSSPEKQSSSDSISIQDDLMSNNEVEEKKRPRRMRLKSSRITRSHSTSSSTQKSPNNLRRSASLHILPKSMSCRTLGELELEEVKGFMDLGFIFKKEHLSPRMMSVLPGLQRLGVHKNEQNTKLMVAKKIVQDDNDDGDEIEEGSRSVIRPYLSEAWLIRKPDSPLLNLRMPKVSTAADMKKYIRSWARTVASVIQQES